MIAPALKFRVWVEKETKMLPVYQLTTHPVTGSMRPMGYDGAPDEELPLMQYTGLKDTDRKEIYEGDIVEFTYWWFDGNVAESILSGVITYDPQTMSYALAGIKNEEWLEHVGECGDTMPFAAFTFCEDDFRVIGNVYQNSELLREKA